MPLKSVLLIYKCDSTQSSVFFRLWWDASCLISKPPHIIFKEQKKWCFFPKQTSPCPHIYIPEDATQGLDNVLCCYCTVCTVFVFLSAPRHGSPFRLGVQICVCDSHGGVVCSEELLFSLSNCSVKDLRRTAGLESPGYSRLNMVPPRLELHISSHLNYVSLSYVYCKLICCILLRDTIEEPCLRHTDTDRKLTSRGFN